MYKRLRATFIGHRDAAGGCKEMFMLTEYAPTFPIVGDHVKYDDKIYLVIDRQWDYSKMDITEVTIELEEV